MLKLIAKAGRLTKKEKEYLGSSMCGKKRIRQNRKMSIVMIDQFSH